jgi:hypothetical protein
MPNGRAQTAVVRANEWFGGAFGAGLVLVLLPCVALYCGIDRLADTPTIGLPVLAVFGILILFGALALVATLFQRLGLSDATQALALPEGSIRAAIAMALIVLFAIISIMLYQSLATPDKPHEIAGLTADQKNKLLSESLSNQLTGRILAVVPSCSVADEDPCGDENTRYKVLLLEPQGREAADLAKQLLVLIGTLMTSLTSFYFASRATSPTLDGGSATDATSAAAAADLAMSGNPDVDGCDVAVTDATKDEDLPAATGGVA